MSQGFALQFSSSMAAAEAIARLDAVGVRDLEAFGPYPAEDIAMEIERVRLRPKKRAKADADPFPPHHSWLPLLALIGGALGGVAAYALQYWTSAIQYPLNVGSRPLNSWPAFIPVTFELTVLFSASFIVVGFFVVNRLPKLYHPLFALPDFERASDDLFFVWVKSRGSFSSLDELRALLETLPAQGVYDVPS
jgi:hypothetical protein